MNMRIVLPLLVSGLVLGGCTNNRYCLKKQSYEDAGSIPPLKSADGLQIPQSAGALVVPPPSAQQVPFGREEKTANGAGKVECLDQPPPIPKPQGNEISG